MQVISLRKWRVSICILSIHVLQTFIGCTSSSEMSDSEQAHEFVYDGDMQYSNGQYADAVISYAKALRMDSTISRAYPGLIKSTIKKDSLVENYFDINLLTNDTVASKFMNAAQYDQNRVYQELQQLKSLILLYTLKAKNGELDEEFKSLDGCVYDVELMYQIAKLYDVNSDGVIDNSDLLQ